MKNEDRKRAALKAHSEPSDSDVERIKANVERYLNNHSREGARAWQMNMAARPGSWEMVLKQKDKPTLDTGSPQT